MKKSIFGKHLASPLSLFAYLQINWNGKPAFVLKALIS
jgi:hypothetical protein